MRAFHHKQPFGPDGNVHASSVTRTMTGQSLDSWEMFTRESLQNSWDARDTTSVEDGVTFAVDYNDLNSDQIELISKSVFGEDVEGLPKLRQSLDSKTLSLLLVSDSGTCGLRGPTVASAITSNSNSPRDFDAFVRNIGRSDSKELKGGTYGFGKGVFFIASRVNTIFVYTRTIDEHSLPVHRFIAMSNDNDFQIGDTLYTGRHWWGVQRSEKSGNNVTEYAEPFVNEEADRLAKALGMDKYFTSQRKTGTCIAVVEPDFDNIDSGLQNIAKSLVRWAWPHMARYELDLDPIDFHVRKNGDEVPIPEPASDPALRNFLRAYKDALDAPSELKNTWKQNFRMRVSRIWSQRPVKELGTLSVVNLLNPISEEETILNQAVEHEIALLRSPRMVVEYWKGPRNISGIPYCGVFIAHSDADSILARSEPAAHHEWNHQAVQQDHQLLEKFWGRKEVRANPVKVLKDRMRQLLKESGSGTKSSGDERHFQSVTQISKRLGSVISNMIGGTDTKIAEVKPSFQEPAIPSSGKNPTFSYTHSSIFLHQDEIYSVFSAKFFVPTDQVPLYVIPTAFIATDKGDIDLDGALELGIVFPEIIGWSASEIVSPDALHAISEPILLNTSESGFSFCIRQPEDTAVGLKFAFQSQEQHQL